MTDEERANLDRVTAERDELQERYGVLSTDFADASVRWKTYANERDAALAQVERLREWKESAHHILGEWHQARELIGGAQIGDGPVEWAGRVRERLERAERAIRALKDGGM